MTHQNLVLTEKAIKNHSKRLQKELKNYSKDISLGEAQTLFSKSLGFNDWKHLSVILKGDMVKNHLEINLDTVNDTEKINLIHSFIVQENLVNLNIYINYLFNKATEAFTSLHTYKFSYKLIYILDKLRFQSVVFQESVAKLIIDIIEKIENKKLEKIFNSEDIMACFCRLQIKPILLDKIIKIFPFKRTDFNVGLIVACENNKTEIVKHLLLNYNLNIDNFFYIGEEPVVFNPLSSAINSNSHEIIDFLLHSPKLKKHANIHIENNNSFKNACKMGDLHIIKTLLKHNKLQNKSFIKSENCIFIIIACEYENWNIVQFLLNEINYDLQPDFYKNITKNLKFFTDINKQNKLQKMIINKM